MEQFKKLMKIILNFIVKPIVEAPLNIYKGKCSPSHPETQIYTLGALQFFVTIVGTICWMYGIMVVSPAIILLATLTSQLIDAWRYASKHSMEEIDEEIEKLALADMKVA